MKGRVLIAAGSDSGGGAGIQADIKAVTALDGYAMTAITALTAQNTQGVFGIVGVEPEFIALQIELVLTDIGADTLKTGMLHSAAVIETVVDGFARHAPGVPLIADPVMVATGGHRLLEEDAVTTLRERLLPAAALITPNLPEAEALLDADVDPDAMEDAAQALRALGPDAVLLKGGHAPTAVVRDVLATEDGVEVIEHERIDTAHTHGTGCTLASAIAAGVARGLPLPHAVRRAADYVHTAIARAPGYGRGHGPLDHAHTVRPFGLEE